MCNCCRSSVPNMHTLALAKYWQPLISLYISLLVLIYIFRFWVHSVCRFFLCAFTSLYVVLIFHNRKHIPVGDSLIMNKGSKVCRFLQHYSNDGFWVFMPHSVMGFSIVSEECEDGSSMFVWHVETKPILLHGVKTQNSIWVESYVMYVSKLLLFMSLKHIIRKWWFTFQIDLLLHSVPLTPHSNNNHWNSHPVINNAC